MCFTIALLFPCYTLPFPFSVSKIKHLFLHFSPRPRKQCLTLLTPNYDLPLTWLLPSYDLPLALLPPRSDLPLTLLLPTYELHIALLFVSFINLAITNS